MPDSIDPRPRLLIFIPAYNAARHIDGVVKRIPLDLEEDFRPHVLIIDDASQDGTTAIARKSLDRSFLPYSYAVLSNPRNQGYGGNQKLGYKYAIDEGFDLVVMVHGDGQYPPEAIGDLARTAREHGAAFGSRFGARGSAIRGGMPWYKWIGNRILTVVQNRLLGTNLTEFHSGFRAYTTDALKGVPFYLNSSDFHFDTEIFIQMTRAGVSIGEIAIPTHYGDEVCHVNGISYARNVVIETLKSRVHDAGFFYEMKFDVEGSTATYEAKLDFDSPSSRVSKWIPPHSTVLDLGSSEGDLAKQLGERNCTVIGVDFKEPQDPSAFAKFLVHDLDTGMPDIDADVDVVLMLDIIEHLRRPESFARELREFCATHNVIHVWVSTGNVAFAIQRLALALGQFNYGPRGILDMTHTRLFTFRTIRRLFRQAGFVVDEIGGVPAPIPLAVSSDRLARALMSLNRGLIKVAPRLFSYQILLGLRPPEPLDRLIQDSITNAGPHGPGATRATSD